jgi:hypothetical protein
MATAEVRGRGHILAIGLLLFATALGMRLLFLDSLPEAAAGDSAYYTGDTPTWLAYAQALHSSVPFDLGLPMRPPGVAYLVSWLWDGSESGVLRVKLAWSLMGALAVVLLYLAVLRSFGLRVAVIAGGLAAASCGLLILSTSINNETPYLVLVLASFVLWPSIRLRPRWHNLLAWAALHGLACLIRAEHVLFFALVSLYLVFAWSRPGAHGAWRKSLLRTAWVTLWFALPLLPWQLHIFSEIERFNRSPLPAAPAVERAHRQLEHALAGLRWSDEAQQRALALPAFSRRTMRNFVAATVAARGGNEVTVTDFAIIEQAFGSYPESLDPFPFVTLYGGLNFSLGNNRRASGGFTRAPLEVPPPLAGGPSRYPGFLIAGLPPPDLTFSYPPHLYAVNHGYLLGWRWIREHPAEFLSLALHKLRIFWHGMALGVTGYNLPLGLSGTRRPVDMVVPDPGPAASLWRTVVLLVLLSGLWLGRRDHALVPWLLLPATKLVATVAFFGYAREGAVLIPVLALSCALLVGRGLLPLRGFAGRGHVLTDPQRWFVAAGLGLALLATEAYRWHSDPVVRLDGRVVGVDQPFPEPDYRVRRLEVH